MEHIDLYGGKGMSTQEREAPGTGAQSMPVGTVQDFDSEEAKRLFTKLRMRLMPLLFLAFCLASIDRINLGFAQLQMRQALGITDAMFGFAAGLVYLAFVIFGVPSNLLLERQGFRLTLLRMMALWGLASTATMFVRTPNELYIARFLLGAFEAGLSPAMFLYLSYWFPSRERGKATSFLMVGVIVSGLIGGPVSGLIMTRLDGVAGMAGWQWLFAVEGLPCALLGIVNYFYFPDRPNRASWLSEREIAILTACLEEDRKLQPPKRKSRYRQAFADPYVWLLAFIYFAASGSGQVLQLWLPTVIRELGVKSIASVGWLSVIPFAAAALGMLVIPRLSDKGKSRRWHYASALFVAAAALCATANLHESLGLSLLALAVFGCVLNGAIGTFWTIPASYLSEEAAPAGIAVISSVSALSNFAIPTMIGIVKGRSGSVDNAFYATAGLLFVAAMLTVLAVPERAVLITHSKKSVH
jgi:MFS family permease